MNITIREENSGDISDIFEVNYDAFGQDDEAKLVNALRKSPYYIPELSLVAEVGDKLVGHILLTKISIQADHKDVTVLALAPIAVSPEYQRKGVGSVLIRESIIKARELDYKAIIVLGHPEYYPKFGFSPASDSNIYPPFDVPSEAFMVYELQKGALKVISGTVKYPEEFNAV